LGFRGERCKDVVDLAESLLSKAEAMAVSAELLGRRGTWARGVLGFWKLFEGALDID
jgi:hypothetical protein